ncbi:MAG: SpoIIE family protein phosphatase [Verrucomicrobia bacterium]|nr:SpoIIE family protein phosphatase [Verrucomicrobiota bacterium]
MDEFSQRKELAYRCLIDAARSLSGAADRDELVGQILVSSRDVMQCLACSISLPDAQTGDLVIRGTQAELKGQVLRVPPGKGIAGRVYRTRVRENIANAQRDSDHYAGIGLETNTPAQAMLTIPLLDGELCHGVMQALNPIDRRRFDAFDEEVFLAFGSLIAATLTRMQVQDQAKQKEIEEAYRQAELSIARQAQFSFMPAPLFERENLKIQVFQEQAADIGGDFYAYHETGDGCLLVAVGDASGKGIPAALESARVCTLISLTEKSCTAERLSEWLADLNNVLQASAEKAGSLTTLAVLLIDGKRRRISACSFGQFRPHYLSRSNDWRELTCPVHAPLGVFTAPRFAVSTVPLSIGRRWILLTDGFVEARNSEGTQFGAVALGRAFSRAQQEESDLLLALEESWREFSRNGPERDDATAVLITDSSPLPRPSFGCEISPEKIPDLRFFCEQWAACSGLGEVEAYQVVLACDEMFTNVFKHAYNSEPGPVQCEANLDLNSLTFLITHWGVGLSSETQVPLAPEPSRVGGYGLPFIRRVFDAVEFGTHEACSTVRLSKRVLPVAASAE